MDYYQSELIKLFQKSNEIYKDNNFETKLNEKNYKFLLVYLNSIHSILKIDMKLNIYQYINIEFKELILISKELMKIVFDIIHSGTWNNIDILFKDLFAYSSILYIYSFFLIQFKNIKVDNNNNNNININIPNPIKKIILKKLDLALIFGDKLFNQVINQIINLISNNNNNNNNNFLNNFKNENYNNNNENEIILNKEKLIKRISRPPSLNEFKNEYMIKGNPCVIENLMKEWPCFNERNWSDLNYLKNVAGSRLVPIEIGPNYLHEKMKQKLINFNKFIDEYIISKNSDDDNDDIGYLAQTKLFEQIPQLRNDILIPEYCKIKIGCGDDDNDNNKEDNVEINAWLGPKGTVTPLHYDPKHNFLCQIVGRKYIKLFSPKESNNLYPHLNSKLFFNTSMVDVENPDHSKFPLFKNCDYIELILNAGEILYIPPTYWHFVKSLSQSFSIFP
ncbi:transcription factor jumonji, jmjC domain-containing protein [Dictyostelium discoideum AX4]|uniref:JmjC domain-containing protein D n=1 Tax=Dictyostelium discoideum TaxID=44689 RepID=JMJCD_DICDI|nr:transcription factor jumonji, jmjC domain-containing protein [Dictyostelium discoideum AX4]Q55DF5.1 RecName: Full=JmjC domain-containing protein D; AltName: Full=Jumonji domain-containing protein D [Dictyostelium discoideum]EAL72803.1 transcription factor jumonji, jmjC domain-containing protein [Dictyostelium discoideum AX4]|eukprot:XP_646176.1 transcription factor jumonji, jmjC domain-containing protein [Dictyostelium discoideum AX4]